ncbi:MAG: neutral zinc metallopeptidase [Planctomycetota bacterium]
MRWQGGEQSGNVEDRRGMRPSRMAIGGAGTIIILILGILLGVDPREINQLLNQVQQAPGLQGQVGQQERPLTAEEKRQKDFVATILRFTEVVWEEEFRKAGEQYRPPRMVLFSQQVSTGCGEAPSAVGPFYCPADRTVYLDPTFFDELQRKLGGSAAEFSQAYVIAHEVGHHVQNLLGYSEIVDRKRATLPEARYNEWSVRLELQADYLAGVWAHYGQQKFDFIEPGDVESAITTANAIGDDRIQRRSIGFTSPEKYTHGTSKQRARWFTLGLKTGDLSMLKKMFEMPYEQL